MSILVSNTLATPTTSFYAALGGGGGGGSLQSPASVVPAVVDGSAYFNIISSTNGTSGLPANPAALLTVSSTTGNNAEVNIFCVGGGNSQLNMGNITGVTLECGAVTPNLLQIQNGNTGTTYLSCDTTSNAITLGNAGAAGTVSVNTKLIYTAAGGPPTAGFAGLNLASGILGIGATTINTGGLPSGVYVVYGQAGNSTDPGDIQARFSTVISMGNSGVCVGGGNCAVAGSYTLTPSPTGLTLTLTAATTAAYIVGAYPIYLF